MSNLNLLPEIEFGFHRVRRLGNSWGFIPLNWLPPGTEIHFTCKTAFVTEEDEEDIRRLPEGAYRLIILQFPAVLFYQPGKAALEVKPWNRFLAPSSTFNANYDYKGTTYRLQSGKILTAKIPETQFTLSEDDGKRKWKSKPVYRKRKAGYIPLIKRG